MYYANQSIKGEQATETVFDFANGEQTSTEKLEYKGKVYNGKLILHANGEVAVCIDDKEHYAYKNKDTDEIVSGIGTCVYDGTTGDFSSNSPVEDIKKQVAAATATSDKVLEGSTIYTLSGLVSGTMANNANKILSATTVTESEDKANALITIPSSGYYDETSQISVPVEIIKNEVSSISNPQIKLNVLTYDPLTSGTHATISLEANSYYMIVAAMYDSYVDITNLVGGEIIGSSSVVSHIPNSSTNRSHSSLYVIYTNSTTISFDISQSMSILAINKIG